MPRIYSDNEKHENLWCGGVNFEKGVGIATTHDKIAVCRVDANGLVIGYGSATITKKIS